MHEQQITKRYGKELSLSLGFYMAALFISIAVAKEMQPGIAQTLVVVTPMLPFLAMIWVIVRHIRRIDEFQRLLILESIAIAAGVTAGLSFTYGFLEGVGFPRLSMFAVWPVMCGTFFVLAMYNGFCRR